MTRLRHFRAATAILAWMVGTWLDPVSAQELSNYVSIKDRIAAYINGQDGSLRATYEQFGIDNVYNVSNLTRESYSYKGIIIDGTFLDDWKSPTFSAFMTSGKMNALVEGYVKLGGVLIVAHSCRSGVRPNLVPNGDLWAPVNYGMENTQSTFGSNYLFQDDSPLAQFIMNELLDYTPYPDHWGFRSTRGWNVLIVGKDDGIPRLLELKHGKGRILLYAGQLTFRSTGGQAKYFEQSDAVLNGFLRYIATYSQVE